MVLLLSATVAGNESGEVAQLAFPVIAAVLVFAWIRRPAVAVILRDPLVGVHAVSAALIPPTDSDSNTLVCAIHSSVCAIFFPTSCAVRIASYLPCSARLPAVHLLLSCESLPRHHAPQTRLFLRFTIR